MNHTKRYFFLIAFSLLMSLVACNRSQITSQWVTSNILIDGNQTDWSGNLAFTDQNESAFGVMNDDTHLYLTFSTTDRDLIAKVLRLGLTVWIDPSGRKKEVFGLKYPHRYPGMGILHSWDRRDAGMETPDLAGLIRSLHDSPGFVEILGSRNTVITRFPIEDTSHIHVKVGFSDYGQFIYELKMPLSGLPTFGSPLSISAGATIGVGLESGNMDRPALSGRGPARGMSGGSRMPGVMGGFPSGGRDGGRRPDGGPKGAMSESLSYWVKVTLAVRE